MNPMAVLHTLREQRQISDLDLQFARLMSQLAQDDTLPLALAAALVSNATGQGHVCLPLQQVAGSQLMNGLQLPERDAWVQLLQQSPVVGTPGMYRPLILDSAGRLYLYRYWRHEQTLAAALRQRAASRLPDVDEQLLRQGLADLFPVAGPTPDWQKLAAATAVLRRFCVISGGPGTGKTSTVVRILALLLQQAAERPLEIALAAPTGKAAGRLQGSIRAACRRLQLPQQLLARMPQDAVTLHRLLGARMDGPGFRHDRDNPLPLDVLILDEASMVDLALMARLVDALGEQTRLILLGDRDQLASVEAGAVLGDICGDAPGFSQPFSQRLAGVCATLVPAGEKADSPLADSVVQLRHSYRFTADSGIGRLAKAVNAGDGKAAQTLLQAGGDLLLLNPAEEQERIVAGYREYARLVADGAPAEEVFTAFARFRVLTVLRQGERGAEGLNALIGQLLGDAGLLAAGRQWYPGRPLMILRNDYNLRLYNGDIGLLLPDRTGRLQACFESADGGIRRIAPARLPAHESAFAMTVHKSQGSEFDQVLLVLPQEELPLLSRELIYTAITRAGQAFAVSGRMEILDSAISRRTRRSSGLREALWGGA